MRQDRLSLAAAAAGLLAASACHAGASLYVDDAGITPAGHCQIESWVRAYRPGLEVTAVPACSTGDTEFSLGMTGYAPAAQDTQLTPGIKHLLHDPEQGGWGMAVSVGALWDARFGRLDGWTVTLPATFARDPQRNTLLHADLGWSKLRGDRGEPTGGLGIEQVLTRRWTGLAELYADGTGLALGELGARRLFGAHASLDLLLSRAAGPRRGRWMTLGFNAALPP